MKKYKFKPIKFDAVKFDPSLSLEGVKFLQDKGYYVDTALDGRVYLDSDDWILYNERRETLVVNNETFIHLFEEVND